MGARRGFPEREETGMFNAPSALLVARKLTDPVEPRKHRHRRRASWRPAALTMRRLRPANAVGVPDAQRT